MLFQTIFCVFFNYFTAFAEGGRGGLERNYGGNGAHPSLPAEALSQPYILREHQTVLALTEWQFRPVREHQRVPVLTELDFLTVREHQRLPVLTELL